MGRRGTPIQPDGGITAIQPNGGTPPPICDGGTPHPEIGISPVQARVPPLPVGLGGVPPHPKMEYDLSRDGVFPNPTI